MRITYNIAMIDDSQKLIDISHIVKTWRTRREGAGKSGQDLK
jgi:hypothetical protein